MGDIFRADVGVPKSDGEAWGDLAERTSPDATLEVSCPAGCFDLEVTASHDGRDAEAFIRSEAIQDDFDTCPNCGQSLNGDFK